MIFKWLQNWFWKRQREIDISILWPVVKDRAGSLHLAHQMFMLHAINDPAWVRFYGEKLWPHVCTLT